MSTVPPESGASPDGAPPAGGPPESGLPGGGPPEGRPPEDERSSRLALRKVTKAFGSIEVLHGIDMEVQSGEIHGLVGQNGAGKSTITKILAGGYPDYGGRIELDGEQVNLANPRAARRSGIAVIYQEFSLVPQMTVAENIVLGDEPGGQIYGPRLARKAAAELLERTGMAAEPRLDAVVHSLSAAEQQRVEIAKALTRDARVVVLDEPTARLAEPERVQLFALMRQIAQRGASLIFISHFLEEVMEVTDEITVLRDGSVVAHGPTSGVTAASLSTALVGRELAKETATGSKRGAAGAEMLRAVGLSGGRQVHDASLVLHTGEILGLGGLVGSGRSSLARMLVGALRPTSGELFVRGELVHFRTPREALRHGIALVPEDRRTQGIVQTSSIGTNLMTMSLAAKRSTLGLVQPRDARRRVREAVARFEVRPADEHRIVGTLSGGNQQKVVLARAVLADPDILVVDQPTAGVDVGTKTEIHAMLRDLAAEGKAVLVVSDDVEELVTLAQRIVVMRRGEIVAECGPDIGTPELVELMSTGMAHA